jgi:hypothetical protein
MLKILNSENTLYWLNVNLFTHVTKEDTVKVYFLSVCHSPTAVCLNIYNYTHLNKTNNVKGGGKKQTRLRSSKSII